MRYLAAVVVLFMLCADANSAVFIVDSLNDPVVDPATYTADCNDGECTLRDAITLAVTDGDEINFSVTGTIVLNDSLPEIYNEVSIIGPGPDNLTVDGGSAVRPFYIGMGANGTLLQGFSMVNGYNDAGDGGGAVKIEFTRVVLRNLVFSNNVSTQYGGAVNSYNTRLTIEECVFANNSALQGGALQFIGESTIILDLIDSTFEANSATAATSIGNGGAVSALVHEMNISGCRFVNNSAQYFGGAIYTPTTDSSSRKTYIDTTEFANNDSGNDGGAIYLQTSSEIKTSLFAENSSGANGGALTIRDDWDDSNNTGVLVQNCTFSGNSATGMGGALLVDLWDRDAVITHSTIVENSCGSLAVGEGGGGLGVKVGNVQTKNNIIINNECSYGDNDCALLNYSGTQTVTSYGYNNIEYPSECVFASTEDATGPAPLRYYRSLADNGGPTRTHSLMLNILGSCTDTEANVVGIDQREMLRDDKECNRGAYEISGYYPLDLNADYDIDLKDCISALQVCTGSSIALDARAARDPDNTVGLDEAITIMQSLVAE